MLNLPNLVEIIQFVVRKMLFSSFCPITRNATVFERLAGFPA